MKIIIVRFYFRFGNSFTDGAAEPLKYKDRLFYGIFVLQGRFIPGDGPCLFSMTWPVDVRFSRKQCVVDRLPFGNRTVGRRYIAGKNAVTWLPALGPIRSVGRTAFAGRREVAGPPFR